MSTEAPAAPVVSATPAPPAPVVTPVVAPVPTEPQTRADVLRGLVTPKGPTVPPVTPQAAPTDGVPAPTAEVIPEADAAPEVEAVAVETPPVQTDGLKYRKKGADGKYITPDTSAKIEFEIGGKPYIKTEAELVRGFARSVEASRIQNENHDIRERVIPEITQRYEQQVQQVRSDFQEQAALNTELLTALANGDEKTLLAYREQWLQQNSPETQLQRTQEQLQAIQQQTEQQTAVGRAVELVNNLKAVVSPTMDKLVLDHAEVFGGEELLRDAMRGSMERFRLSLSGPPAQRASAVVQFVQGPLSQWVTETATQLRSRQTAAQTARENAEVEAQRARQLQRQAESRGLVPVGQTPGSSLPAPRSSPPTKAEVLANLRGGAAR